MITKVDRRYLEINSIDEINLSKKPKSNCKVEKKNPPDFQINKFFYKKIGKSYRWIDRLVWNDTKWMDYTNNLNLETYILSENDNLLNIFFDKESYDIKGWTTTDVYLNTVETKLFDINTNKMIDKKLFRVQNYIN